VMKVVMMVVMKVVMKVVNGMLSQRQHSHLMIVLLSIHLNRSHFQNISNSYQD